jgi:PPK2 family polyphosphate:nucleotide phosphotransferase
MSEASPRSEVSSQSKLPRHVIDMLMVAPGKAAHLGMRSTKTVDGFNGSDSRESADDDLVGFKADLDSVQELFYASGRAALLVIFQALDAAGKDGTINHVLSGVNPQGCSVSSFKVPSAEELTHDFLWRATKELPRLGMIGVFNRSYYEDVLVTKVHPELIAGEHLSAKVTNQFWAQRYEDINGFERHLDRSGTKVVKFFLHVSKDEQGRRFLERLSDPDKLWKFSSSDIAERKHFDEYQVAYEEALSETSTSWAPWYVIPADRKSVMRALVGGVLVDVLDRMDLHVPEVAPDQRREFDDLRAQLLAENGSSS